MKIEKLTENKIRIILKQEDLKDKEMDLHTIMTKTAESQGLFLEILKQAQKEVGFTTDGCRLLIEAYSSPDDIFVFTITKFSDRSPDDNSSSHSLTKKLKVKRKHVDINARISIYRFEDFEAFCGFCHFLKANPHISLRGLIGCSRLYHYQDAYYLALSEIKVDHKCLDQFYTSLSEFGKLASHSEDFECKLTEHGEIVIKKKALSTGIKYFSNF